MSYLKDFFFNDEVQKILHSINNNVMEYNIFEISGMGTQEIKHSTVLAWLFNNSEHGLEYLILEDFLKKVIEANQEENQNTEDAQSKILFRLQSYIYLAKKRKNITIYRERDNVDLLIVDDANKVAIVIENKVYAKERTSGSNDDGQLDKYEKIINKKFSSAGYEKYFIFLTLNSDEPIKGNEYWMKANYQMLYDIIAHILKNQQELSQKTRIIFESYNDLLKRRKIVSSKEIEELANRIWAKPEYKQALEILYEYKPDTQQIINAYLIEKLENEYNQYVRMEASSKAYVRFSDKMLDSLEMQHKGNGWTKNINRILVYEFNNLSDSLTLDLIIGPGDINARKSFANVNVAEVEGYKSPVPINSSKSWPRALKLVICEKEFIQESDDDAIKDKIDRFLNNFFSETGQFIKIQHKMLNNLG